MQRLDELLDFLVTQQGSDLHLLAGQPPVIRRFGELRSITRQPLSRQQTQDMVMEILSPRIRETFEARDQADFAYVREGGGRYRVNVFRHLGGIGAIFRAIPEVAPRLEDLELPATVASICLQRQGLILVTGKTGSGKSTTLAAMVDYINRRIHGHILTIEDPIEFVHDRKKCLISQREVGEHAQGFSSALRSALREDPDVVLVGEMRDLDTIGLAVTAAETGILVMGTLHTNSAAASVDRIINTFPADKQGHVRTMLSTSLRGIISQQLIPHREGEGMVAAVEILLNTAATANAIREGKIEQLENIIQGGALVGMQSMDNALRGLLDERRITGDAAYEAAVLKSQFEHHRAMV